jgi:recombination protein RecA
MAVKDKESTKTSNNLEDASLEERRKVLSYTLDKIEKDFGKGAIMKLGDRQVVSLDAIPTGALALDLALGVGGLPRGRIVEIYGPESSGKTTLTLSIIAEAQRNGGIAAFIDAEHAMDPEYAGKIGVKIDELLISQPDTGEQALEITEQLVRSGAVDIVVIDSVAALVPKAEIEGEMGDSHVGLQARLMSQALRKLTAIVGKTRTTVVFINQLRQKIGVMYGNPETTTGGNALKFYASVRLDIRRIETLKKDGEEYGNRVKVRAVKNKVAPPFKICEFDILFGEGISSEGCVLDVATDLDIVKKSGTWYSYKDEKIGQGREKARDFLKDNPDTLKKIDTEVRAKIAAQRAAASANNALAASAAAAPALDEED